MIALLGVDTPLREKSGSATEVYADARATNMCKIYSEIID